MQFGYPKSIFCVLEPAERHAEEADVPADKQNELTYCPAKGLLTISERAPEGRTPCRTIRKPATELRLGDVVQFQPDDLSGFTVEQIQFIPDETRPRTVKVWGNGGLMREWRYDAMVTLWDGPLPQRVYSDRLSGKPLSPQVIETKG